MCTATQGSAWLRLSVRGHSARERRRERRARRIARAQLVLGQVREDLACMLLSPMSRIRAATLGREWRAADCPHCSYAQPIAHGLIGHPQASRYGTGRAFM